jgi:hypothetical protein
VEFGSNLDIDMDGSNPEIQCELDTNGYTDVFNKVERTEVNQSPYLPNNVTMDLQAVHVSPYTTPKKSVWALKYTDKAP